MSRLRRPISASIRTTDLPRAAGAAPTLAVVVVLPTPPFPEVNVMTRPRVVCCCSSPIVPTFIRRSGPGTPGAAAPGTPASAAQPVRPPRLDDDLTVLDPSEHRPLGPCALLIGRASKDATDAQLRRHQAEGTDDGTRIAIDPGVDRPADRPPDDDVTGGIDLGPGVDVTHDHHVAVTLHRRRSEEHTSEL